MIILKNGFEELLMNYYRLRHNAQLYRFIVTVFSEIDHKIFDVNVIEMIIMLLLNLLDSYQILLDSSRKIQEP